MDTASSVGTPVSATNDAAQHLELDIRPQICSAANVEVEEDSLPTPPWSYSMPAVMAYACGTQDMSTPEVLSNHTDTAASHSVESAAWYRIRTPSPENTYAARLGGETPSPV